MIKKYIVENKSVIFGIIFSPFIMYSFNVCVAFLFNLGVYYGTFLRNLYEIVVC